MTWIVEGKQLNNNKSQRAQVVLVIFVVWITFILLFHYLAYLRAEGQSWVEKHSMLIHEKQLKTFASFWPRS